MKKEEEFLIDLSNLKSKIHSFSYEVADAFFEEKENTLVEGGDCKIALELDRRDSMATLKFNIEGHINLLCDRSLDEFKFPVELERNQYFRFSEEYEEVSEDMTHLGPGDMKVDVGDLINEFILLSVPTRKIHPRYKDEGLEDGIFYTSSGNEEEENGEDNSNDPRWDKLRNIKF